QHVEQEIHLHQQRRAAHELDQQRRRRREHAQARTAQQGQHQPQHDGQQHAQRRGLHGDHQSRAQCGQYFPGKSPIKNGIHRTRNLRSSRRIPAVITNATAKYSSSRSRKTSVVRRVSALSIWPRNVRSVMVISETSAVFFNSSISRLPAGGSMAGKACGSTMRRMLCADVMFSATAASRCPGATAWMAPRTTSAPYAPALAASTTMPTVTAGSFMPNKGST